MAITETAQTKLAEAEPAWSLCQGCRALLYGRRLHRAHQVCPECGYHHRLTAPQRISQLFDADGLELLDCRAPGGDVLEFTDRVSYPQRLEAARESTGLDEAVVLASGTICGNPVVAAVMDFRFLGGSLGTAVGELVTRAAELALARRIPLLLVTASGGARMQEGALSLMQMAKTSSALAQLDEAGVFTVSLLTDPTYGGVAASFANLCDVIVAEPGARMGFAGARVIKQTVRETLPDGFQTAEFLAECGMIDVISPRSTLTATLGRLLAAGSGERSEPADLPGADPVITDAGLLPEVEPWQAVQASRVVGRPTTLDYLARSFEEFTELCGDRAGDDCPAIVGGLARIDGTPVVVVGHQKGRTPSELSARNYGMATPSGYRKAARLMRTAAKLGLPVVTIVDTPGAYPGSESERTGQATAIAEGIQLMAGLPVPVVTFIAGEGGSGGALALAVADRVLICSNGIYSVISPEGCASILWNDAAMAPTAAKALRLDARQLLAAGVVDGVVPEPEDGAPADHRETADRVRNAVTSALREVSDLDPSMLVARRRARFRGFGLGEAGAFDEQNRERS